MVTRECSGALELFWAIFRILVLPEICLSVSAKSSDDSLQFCFRLKSHRAKHLRPTRYPRFELPIVEGGPHDLDNARKPPPD
jgi:hypothetical protein